MNSTTAAEAPPPATATASAWAPVPTAPRTPLHDLSPAARRLHALLPQTQCTRCGFPDCASYAQAIAESGVAINRCPPGGEVGIQRLAHATGRPAEPLDPAHGIEATRALAVIDEAWCIGCTLCLKACPVDCIVGASKRMHTVIAEHCTGCELCLPVCPVDCIEMVNASGQATGWAAWSEEQADTARQRYDWHLERGERERQEHDHRLAAKAQAKLDDLAAHSRLTDPDALQAKRAVIEAALARARARRPGQPAGATDTEAGAPPDG